MIGSLKGSVESLGIDNCIIETAGGVGYRVTHWDYNANVLPSSPQFSGGANVTGCTTWAVAT